MLVPMFFNSEYVSLLFNKLNFDIYHEVLNVDWHLWVSKNNMSFLICYYVGIKTAI